MRGDSKAKAPAWMPPPHALLVYYFICNGKLGCAPYGCLGEIKGCFAVLCWVKFWVSNLLSRKPLVHLSLIWGQVVWQNRSSCCKLI